jgi:signal peptidase II
VSAASIKGGFVFLIVLLIDQISKALVLAHIPLHGAIYVAPHLNVVHVLNRGITFGLLSTGAPWQMMIIWSAVILLLAYLIQQFFSASHLGLAICLGSILGGAVGNIIDRAIHGAVVDFIDIYVTHFHILSVHIPEWHWPAFNIADSAVVVGAVVWGCIQWCQGRKTAFSSRK